VRRCALMIEFTKAAGPRRKGFSPAAFSMLFLLVRTLPARASSRQPLG
jgi:hypothetical protein